MATTGLNHYNLRAPRDLLDALRAFYCDVVGLRQGERPPFAFFGYWLYAGDDAIVHLSEARPGETRATHVPATIDHVAFTCTDAKATAARLEKMRIPFDRAVVPARRCVQFFLEDPAGNGVELNFAEDAQ
jgi:catechol 2,3-dioxygenase-like lactoylglutathione lyase family enzyme